MERNANDFGNQNTSDASGAGYGGTSGEGSQAGSQGHSASGTADASFSRDTSSDAQNVADRARSALSDAGSTVRDRAGNLKNSLADALESGAERLRHQNSGGGQMAGAAATGGSAGMVSEHGRMADMSNQVAGGLQGAADWLRDADLDGMKSGLERQVKEHPGRTLAIAVGLGYLLGKAIRK